MGNTRLKYCLICEQWGQEEQNWFDLFSDVFQQKDNIELNIYVPVNSGLNKISIETHITKPKLENHPSPLAVNIIETNDFRLTSCDYWLGNTCFDTYGNSLRSRFGVIENLSLKALDESYSTHFPSKNAYEYDFLVNSYDFESTGVGFEQTELGLIPKQFGSSGGENFERILRMLDKHCGDEAKILEIGCGAGAFYKTLTVNKKNYLYTGIDASRKQILRCQRNYPVADFRVGNTCNLSFRNNSYHFVFENNVLIFVSDPLKAIEEMCRVSSEHVFFAIHLLEDKKGLYCYYPFMHTITRRPETKRISVSSKEERFFSGKIWYELEGEHKIKAMTVKVPTYLPSVDEFRNFLKELLNRRSITIVKETRSHQKKMMWIDPNKTPLEIINDDCVVTETDQKANLETAIVTYLFKKSQN